MESPEGRQLQGIRGASIAAWCEDPLKTGGVPGPIQKAPRKEPRHKIATRSAFYVPPGHAELSEIARGWSRSASLRGTGSALAEVGRWQCLSAVQHDLPLGPA